MAEYHKGAEAHDVPLATHAAVDEDLHDYMKNTDADKHDMLRLGKEQEMKARSPRHLSLKGRE